uniref:Uncharacterized protein n=1 Tax=Trichuris muris TaxID=70415 RepID=A0A5S6QPY0_TRIMR
MACWECTAIRRVASVKVIMERNEVSLKGRIPARTLATYIAEVMRIRPTLDRRCSHTNAVQNALLHHFRFDFARIGARDLTEYGLHALMADWARGE